MRRWWPFGAPLVAGLLVLGSAGIMTLSGQTAARAQNGDLNELARRVIGGPGAAASVTLLPGTRPSDLPLNLPLPNGANVVGGVVREGGPIKSWDIVLDVPTSPMEAGGFFDQALPPMGFTQPPAQGDQPPPQGLFCQSQNGPFVGVVAVPVSETASDVRIHVEQGNPIPCGGQPPQP